VVGCAAIDSSEVELSVTFNSTPGVAVDSEQVASVALDELVPLESPTETMTTSCGTTGHADDASDAMKEVGGVDTCWIVSVAVVRRSGGDVSA